MLFVIVNTRAAELSIRARCRLPPARNVADSIAWTRPGRQPRRALGPDPDDHHGKAQSANLTVPLLAVSTSGSARGR